MNIQLRNGGRPGDQEPSERQKSAGNYPKGHVNLHGMRISIENGRGSRRRGVDDEGNPWEQELAHDYGYIRGTTGKDKDHLDVFLGPHTRDPEAKIFVIDQNRHKDPEERFDEHKVMAGFRDADDAVLAYYDNYPPGWDGFRGVTEMSVPEFRKWAAEGRSGKRKPAADYVRFQRGGSVDADKQEEHFVAASSGAPDKSCSCGDGAQMPAQRRSGGVGPRRFAEGGSTGAFVGYKSAGRRKEKNNDREAAKGVPISAVRGAVAGLAGLPGDLEGLGRMAMNLPSLNPVQALLSRAVGPVDTTPALPTSEFYNEWLPGRQQGAANRAAEVVGNVLGLDPRAAARPVMAAGRQADRVVGALAQAAEQGYRRAEPALERGFNRVMDRGGLPAQLLQDLTQGAGAYAVKPKGGNWLSAPVGNAVNEVTRQGFTSPQPGSVNEWLDRRLTSYIRNQLGTADDPLLKLEQQGRLHLSPEDILEKAQGQPRWKNDGPWAGYGAPENAFAGDELHANLTGREYRTPWEALSDYSVGQAPAKTMLRNYESTGSTPPDWLSKVDPEQQIYEVDRGAFRNLGFDHVRDYLQQATDAGRAAQLYGRDPGAYAGEQGRQVGDLIARNLDINPDDLAKMSLSDVVSKTSDWNKFIYKAKQLENMNKGVKSVLKQYPDNGYQWVELAPEGLKAEGDAMRHCVGGYCSSVEDGSTRILSLRDKSGKPYATVELGRPKIARENMVDDIPSEEYNRMLREAEEAAEAEGYDLDNVDDDAAQAFVENHFWDLQQQWLQENNARAAAVTESTPWDIRQIKGPANRAPSADVLPMVQDFVKNMGPWGQIDDLRNTGLQYLDENMSLRGAQGNLTAPPGYYNRDELSNFMRERGFAEPEIEQNANFFFTPRRGYASGGSVQPDCGCGGHKEPVRKATGGGIGNPFVNGWGFTGNAVQPQQGSNPFVQQALSPVAAYQKQWQAGQKDAALPDPANGPLTSQQALPTLSSVSNGIDPVTGMPVYNLSDPQSMMALQWVRQAGDVGKMVRGLGASAMSPQQTMDLAKRFGYDTSAAQQWLDAQPKTQTAYSGDETQTPYEVPFNPTVVTRPEDAAAELDRVYQRLAQADQFAKMLPAGAQNPYSVGIDPYQELQARLNNSMKDIYTIEGFSGWNPSAKDPRQGTAGMYRLEDGALRPVSPGVARHLPQTDDGTAMKQFLTSALSIVGGPLLGAAGLGLTSTQAGLATGAANYAITGNPTSFLGSLGGLGGSYLGGSLGSTLGGATGQQIGSWAGNQAGKYLGQQVGQQAAQR